MSLDRETVRRVAKLARIRVDEHRLDELAPELNQIIGFVEQLDEVQTEGVEPMTSVAKQKLRWRADEITDGGRAAEVTGNAPASDMNFFAVPKVVE
ncbi:MAG: Asp-tRNA(Asn)/Glu-tRNA(Gln) amidotransferase subunit GatC [Minwuia sp.]|uniref:Asp-tRNA(Asn)/Glu-tRNA(Gln) amidotransferase subunit GatC n=1 Tax=Minwuia sp. TaxID=2493630 RepID=UPI003A8A2AD2